MKYKTHMNYDNTKKMLNTLRTLNESIRGGRVLKEQNDESSSATEDVRDNITVVNDVEVRMLSTDDIDLQLTDQHKQTISGLIDNVKTQVSDLVDLRPGFTLEEGSIRLDGILPDVNLKFVFIAGVNAGVYLNADMLKVEIETVQSVEKLLKFESTFTDAMNDLISQRRVN
jgi:hypothetical protein